ncbi:hypothetical protein [Luteimonas terrae]|uniref:SLATT domain-containing protein n=1 Tax=Luteimonas terrae TaxID=1530191 RepID=A0ABU1XVC5_9GAMM|nr:hypothetical protein [Luteimonas terrae]MDR7192714.1 hypothetical protein [Luteimonas terrae]
MEPSSSAGPLTHYQALLDIDYAAHLAELHCRLLRRVDRIIVWLGLAGGTTSLASAFAATPVLAGIGGAVVTVLSLYALAFRPAEAAEAHAADKRKFLALKARASTMSPEKITSALARIQIDAQSTWDCLQLPAYNDVVTSAGRPEAVQKTTRWENFIRAIA